MDNAKGSRVAVFPPSVHITKYEDKPKTVEIHVEPAVIKFEIRKQEERKTPSIRKEK